MKPGDRVRIVKDKRDPSNKVGKEGVYMGIWKDGDGVECNYVTYPHVVCIDGYDYLFRPSELVVI